MGTVENIAKTEYLIHLLDVAISEYKKDLKDNPDDIESGTVEGNLEIAGEIKKELEEKLTEK